MADAVVTTQAVIDSGPAKRGAEEFNRALSTMRDNVVRTSQSIDQFTGVANAVRSAFVTMAGAFATKAVVDALDNYTRLKNRLESLTGSAEAGAEALSKIKAAAKDSRTSSSDLADAFGKIVGTLKENNLTQDEAIRSFSLLSKSMQIGGATSDQVKVSLDALSRSFAAGRFEGRQFITLMEDAPLLMQKLQASTGLSAKQLRAWAMDGKITGATVVSLLNSVADDIDAKFKTMPRTVGGSVQVLANTLTTVLGAAFSDSGEASSKFIDAMDRVRDKLRSPEMKTAARSFADAIGEAFAAIEKGASRASQDVDNIVKDFKGIDWNDSLANQKGNISKFLFGTDFGMNPQKPVNPFSFGTPLKSMPGDILKGVADAASNPWKTTVDAANASSGNLQLAPGVQETELKKIIELESLQRELSQAQAVDDKARVAAIQEELAVRQKINPELAKVYPELAQQLEAQIRLTEETKRQMQIFQENKAIAGEFFQTMNEGFTSGIKGGSSFLDTLRSATASVVELIAKFTILNPLKRQFENAGASWLGSMGFNPEQGLLGGLFNGGGSTTAGSAANGGWSTTVSPSLFGFADGGSFQVGGSGGTDSQMVAFRASPDETVTIRRPDQMRGDSGQPNVVNVSFNVAGDATEDTLSKMRAMAQQVFAQNSPQLVRSSVDAVQQRNQNDRNYLRR